MNKETGEKIKYDDYRLMSEERRKEYNVYPKLQVYNVFNVAQTNLQEARPELYKKLEAAAGVNRPLNQSDDFSFPAMDKMIKEKRMDLSYQACLWRQCLLQHFQPAY